MIDRYTKRGGTKVWVAELPRMNRTDSSCLEVKEVSVSLVWRCNYAGIISSLFSLSNESLSLIHTTVLILNSR